MQHRDRKHAEYHERRLEQQMLDALLRIEEILARAFPEEVAKEAEVVEPPPPPKGKRR
jgi:hypothetical protein